MQTIKLYEGQFHEWVVFGRDPEKNERIIDTNQFMIKTGREAILLDPGGIELFSSMLAAVVHFLPVDQITHLFASHQDPDVISSLGLWDKTLPNATLHAPWIWEGFLRHYGCEAITYNPIPDEGQTLKFDGLEIQFIPAHYMHSSGNFSVYDPVAKILFSGDIGAGLNQPEDSLFVEDFDKNISKIKTFHQRWMPSEHAKDMWIKRVRKLDIEMLCPQHGSIYKGEDVHRFLDWLESIEVGAGLRF
ncbi:MBL fold metallo-hydrolase [Terasakiella sp. SH-1]|uniref:MBL fold metallo-hydrolase n=1 Tax=Terasakiella sp. SH-1 TaxID=2560057 RepID=UPI0010738DCA|nr:MBL fold metallo-hydrolase [Terasakiella sp. SH-1]